MVKKFIIFILLGLSTLMVWMLWNMSTFYSKQINISNLITTNKIDFLSEEKTLSDLSKKEELILNLSESLKYKTISYQDSNYSEPIHFLSFHKFLERVYPKVFSQLEKRIFSNYSLLLKWEGVNNTPHNPILFMAHMDVVPIENYNLWDHPPFSGNIDNEYVWGRGALDDKSSLIAILESIEYLLDSGFSPNRDIYFAIGHDEENSGIRGNAVIADSLASEGIYFDMIIDEGSVITDGIIPGMDKPVAIVGVAEKGYASFELICNHESGHSSMPNNETTIGMLAKAIVALETNKMPAELTDPVISFFNFLGPEMTIQDRFFLSNSSFFATSILNNLDTNPITSAMVRTTIAPTIINGGLKSNILPSTAKAVVNYRIRQGDSIDRVKKHITSTINNDLISVSQLKSDLSAEPSKVSSTKSPEFHIIHKSIKEVFGDVIVSPGMILATTDSRHYQNISKNIYRFMPIQLSSNDLSMIHGANEKISIESYMKMIEFYIHLIQNIHAS
tara:strand:- start:18506 stop:20017 length:1512 start_codon:yes stop_codon:yes gene_type:complete